MRRRSFLRSLALGSAAAELASKLTNAEIPAVARQAGGRPRFEINDALDLTGLPLIDGLSSGVAAVDEVTNGFHRGQLISVSGPLEHINHALITRSVVHLALTEHVVDFVVTEGSFDKYLADLLGGPDSRLKEQVNLQVLGDKGSCRKALRLPDVDLGDPTNDGWKKYKVLARADPPNVIILDGVKYIELFLREADMARQLKTLAVELQIPVLVHAPSGSTAILRSNSKQQLRNDFARVGDAFIRLTPDYACDLRYSRTEVREFYAIRTLISAEWCPCPKHAKYCSEVKLQYSRPFGQFKSL